LIFQEPMSSLNPVMTIGQSNQRSHKNSFFFAQDDSHYNRYCNYCSMLKYPSRNSELRIIRINFRAVKGNR